MCFASETGPQARRSPGILPYLINAAWNAEMRTSTIHREKGPSDISTVALILDQLLPFKITNARERLSK